MKHLETGKTSDVKVLKCVCVCACVRVCVCVIIVYLKAFTIYI